MPLSWQVTCLNFPMLWQDIILFRELTHDFKAGKNWLQPLRTWILETKKAKKLASSENYEKMKRFVQKHGTNPKFLDKSISFSFCPPWDFVALRLAQSPNAERRSREAILSSNGESCDWWTILKIVRTHFAACGDEKPPAKF
ncbi:MAG: hypothetical protein Athens071412_357 [Parcubacteria group bacterium Athens0714_12]|nr:MAG: hypothetical protein Athens071412_357 [Parcubacteria group bacterium Athens0714_12]